MNDSNINATTWLQAHAIPIRSVAPDDDDFSDLQSLKQTFGTARIVMLGEQSHGDGTTFPDYRE